MKIFRNNILRVACNLMKRGSTIASVILLFGVGSLYSQPGPPPGGMQAPLDSPAPPPPPGTMPPPISPAPFPGDQPTPPPGWSYQGYLSNPPSADWMNQGYLNVMATGYDSESVLVQIPLYVSYSFNGANYDVTVLNSWNPYTQTWNIGVDTPAYKTYYFFNGFNYNYYAVLPSGTYYFNL